MLVSQLNHVANILIATQLNLHVVRTLAPQNQPHIYTRTFQNDETISLAYSFDMSQLSSRAALICNLSYHLLAKSYIMEPKKNTYHCNHCDHCWDRSNEPQDLGRDPFINYEIYLLKE